MNKFKSGPKTARNPYPRIVLVVLLGLVVLVTLGFQLNGFITYLSGGRVYYYENNLTIVWIEIIVLVVAVAGIVKLVYDHSVDIYLETGRESRGRRGDRGKTTRKRR